MVLQLFNAWALSIFALTMVGHGGGMKSWGDLGHYPQHRAFRVPFDCMEDASVTTVCRGVCCMAS